MNDLKEYRVFASTCSVTLFARSPEDAIEQAKKYYYHQGMQGKLTARLYSGCDENEKRCGYCVHFERDTDCKIDWSYDYCKKHNRRVYHPLDLLPCDDYEEDNS